MLEHLRLGFFETVSDVLHELMDFVGVFGFGDFPKQFVNFHKNSIYSFLLLRWGPFRHFGQLLLGVL